jgi:hypothetical protein
MTPSGKGPSARTSVDSLKLTVPVLISTEDRRDGKEAPLDAMTIEHVTYRLRPGADRLAFVEANDRVDAFLARQSGFEARQLAQDADGTWIDLVWWADRSSAEAAAQAFARAPEAIAVSGLIDPDGMVFRHLDLVRESPAEPASR